MPEKLPIRPYSITSSDLPPHLRRKKVNWGFTEKKQHEKIFSDERDNEDALAGQSSLLANQYLEIASNVSKLKIATYYERDVSQLHISDWHIIRFDTLELSGDKGFIFENTSPVKNAYFQANVRGRYRISCNLRFYFVDAGGYLRDEQALDYFVWQSANFPLYDFQLGIYKTDGTLKEIIAAFPMISYTTIGTDPYVYHVVIPLNGSTILDLSAGEKIDFRVNLLSYVMLAYPLFRFYGSASMNLVKENENN